MTQRKKHVFSQPVYLHLSFTHTTHFCTTLRTKVYWQCLRNSEIQMASVTSCLAILSQASAAVFLPYQQGMSSSGIHLDMSVVSYLEILITPVTFCFISFVVMGRPYGLRWCHKHKMNLAKVFSSNEAMLRCDITMSNTASCSDEANG